MGGICSRQVQVQPSISNNGVDKPHRRETVEIKRNEEKQQSHRSERSANVRDVPSEETGSISSYTDVDKHARNAPTHAKRSVQSLVQYLTNGFTDPKLHVRAFYVWISENIRYDTDGYFGHSEMLSCDADSVLTHGRSVCEGYARLMEAFCKQANIPVQKISGFAKGYSYSPDRPFTTNTRINHAWTAVQLNGKWHLIDATWGSGHVDSSGQFVKKFGEFYFLTNPSHFVNKHFPYMDNDLTTSSRWQLLEKPITLQHFNDSVCIQPNAFRLGISPMSHVNTIIKLSNETTLTFKTPKGNTFHFSSKLMQKGGNYLREMPRSTSVVITDTVCSVRLHPRSTGSYVLRIFGGEGDENNKSLDALFEYVVQCSEVKDPEFEFPLSYTRCQTDKCVLVTPMQYRLKANSELEFHIQSPSLQRVMVNKIMLQKTGNSFKGKIQVGSSGRNLGVFGSTDDNSPSLKGLYMFEVK